MASEAVLKYLVDTNRPYSCADVTVNLRGAYTKNAVQKALDALSESGKIKCKLYGKQKVYAALQLENVEESSDTEDYDTQISNITNILNDKTSDLKKAEANLKNLVSAPTNDMTKSQIEEVKNSIDKLEKKLTDLRNTTEVISAGEKKILLEEHEKSLKEYRKRKRISSDMLDAVLEGYPKSKRSFLEEFCIETDEMVNFSLKTQ
ncbi:homologous-pairing protein 2 homolog [Maniola hyperantus]|uniref:homologous-pairing protein 2 homolog n=1 Tax=Aphantopus hyperantus TaxID=2795564 RepID=UPI001569F451|nr:homologous-pairing protein 2 homolog [Maniola hyperantus]